MVNNGKNTERVSKKWQQMREYCSENREKNKEWMKKLSETAAANKEPLIKKYF